MSKLLEVKISKCRWQRGKIDSALRMDNGKQCCIGFLARKLGVKIKEIKNIPTLTEVDNKEKVGYFSSRWYDILSKAYEVNDSEDLTDTERMLELKKIGKEMGVRFIFIP